MKAKGLWFGRTGHGKGRLIGKQALKAKLIWPKNTHWAGAKRYVGGTHLGPLWIAGGQRVALGLFHQTAGAEVLSGC